MGEGEKGKNTREIQTRCLIQLSSNKSQNQSSQQRKEYMYQGHILEGDQQMLAVDQM